MADLPIPSEGILLTHFMVSDDVERSRRFYTEVLGGETVREGEPSDPDRTSSFLNIRVADIEAVYREWSARGAEFLTPPQDRGAEIRCYLRDPDGHLIEVGQTNRAVFGA
jgi:catechol 2,3-dioxygenase-like lactoylglutathione lyase family enzyme